ncbi:MAG: hypothetical protein RLZZ387_3736 [Chloroflexota bacterium]|jgi:hypothetical protein
MLAPRQRHAAERLQRQCDLEAILLLGDQQMCLTVEALVRLMLPPHRIAVLPEVRLRHAEGCYVQQSALAATIWNLMVAAGGGPADHHAGRRVRQSSRGVIADAEGAPRSAPRQPAHELPYRARTVAQGRQRAHILVHGHPQSSEREREPRDPRQEQLANFDAHRVSPPSGTGDSGR